MGVITTVDTHIGVTLLDEQRITSPRGTATVCPSCGGSSQSDPSVMLGLVLVLVANTLVVAALVAAAVWLLA